MKPSDELEQLLKNLHLNRILDIYSEQLSSAEKEDVSYSEFLTRLLRASIIIVKRPHWRGGSSAPTCPRTGRWPASPSHVSPESTASRSTPWPSWTSSPKRRTWCWSGRPVWAKLDWRRACC